MTPDLVVFTWLGETGKVRGWQGAEIREDLGKRLSVLTLFFGNLYLPKSVPEHLCPCFSYFWTPLTAFRDTPKCVEPSANGQLLALCLTCRGGCQKPDHSACCCENTSSLSDNTRNNH